VPHDRRPARGRADWPVRVFRLGEEPADDLLATTTVEQRLAMVTTLSDEASSLAGQPHPNGPRSSAPVRVIDLVADR
jgi:hypothetical protein